MAIDNNKQQVDIENLFKQNELDLNNIKELYRRLKELGEKIKQIKYIDTTLATKLKRDYESLKRIIIDENVSVQLYTKIDNTKTELNNKIDNNKNDIQLQLDTKTKEIDKLTKHTNGYINTSSYRCNEENCTGGCNGIKADGIHDDTSGINKIISDINQLYTMEKYNGNINTIAFSNGQYRITSQIKVPFYIHFKMLGNVVFLTEVANDSAIWFTPEEDLPIDYSKDWFRGKTIGELIDGSTGGLFIKNNLSTVSYNGWASCDKQGSIGLEIGARKETTPWRIESFTSLKNVRIELFNIGLQTNSYHFYINKFTKILTAFNDINISVGSKTEGSDSGENISFDFSTIADSKVGVLINNSGYDVIFNNCSIDYNYLAFANEKPTGSNIVCNDCNIEGFYSKVYNDVSTSQVAPLKTDYFGLYKNLKSDGFYSSSLILNNTKLVPTKGTGKIIDGVQGRTNVIFNEVYLITPMEAEKYFHLEDWLFMCTDNVKVLKNKIYYMDRRLGAFSKKDYCLIQYPTFKETVNETELTSGIKINGNTMELWENTNLSKYEIANNTTINNLRLKLTGTSGEKKIKLQTTNSLIVEPGDELIMTCSFACNDNMNVKMYLQYLDKDNKIIGTSSPIQKTINSGFNWKSYNERLPLRVGRGIYYVKPIWEFTNDSTNDNISISNLYVYKI